MREILFTNRNVAAQEHFIEGDVASYERVRLAAAWQRTTELALESARTYGLDFPVGAVALDGVDIVGRGFANDNRFGHGLMHAEVMANSDTMFNHEQPDTIVVNVEPCPQCQRYLSGINGLKKVAFGLSRHDLADKGLLRPHDEDIFSRAADLPFEVEQIDDPALRADNLAIYDHVQRDSTTGLVRVDYPAMVAALNC